MPAARLTPRKLRDAAEVAAATRTVITIEAGGVVYRIAPEGHSLPITASEKDRAACDEAFGVSG